MRFVDLFSGLGGFHYALHDLGHECVFASELNDELAAIYAKNFPKCRNYIHGDIRQVRHLVPAHDILCAGFPCQPFSKSGTQNGRRDKARGTLFYEILEILRLHLPMYVILENVGNFERHNNGRTWKLVVESLTELGYDVRGTTHKSSGGHGLVSPHHFGFPHTRERFFIVASQGKLPSDPFPRLDRTRVTTLSDIVQPRRDLTVVDVQETMLSRQQSDCINHWNRFLKKLPKEIEPPSFPIWGDEIDAWYPFEDRTPFSHTHRELFEKLRSKARLKKLDRRALLSTLPSYARTEERRFPNWKVQFIRQNREWLRSVRRYFPTAWAKGLRDFPPSLRKLEWNCKGEERDLWRHVLQFRPSGLRAKRYSSAPALVAMTTTQIPILGPKRRFITRVEGLRLQGFSDSIALPSSRATTFAALGNAVHVGVAKAIAKNLMDSDKEVKQKKNQGSRRY